MNYSKYIIVLTLLIGLGFSFNAFSQTIANVPCGNPPPAAIEWTDGDCAAVSTTGFANNMNITSCGPLATTTIDGWGWYTGTGGGTNDLTFTPSGGGDAIIQVFESAGDPCVDGFFIGACSDAAGAGGAETVTGGGTAGQVYIFIIENAASSGAISGTLCITENSATCSDGIQNGTETGVDCGGSCPFACPPPTTASTTACPTVVNSTIDPIDCSLVGTPAFAASSGTVVYSGTSSSTNPPSPGAPCGNITGGTDGCWARYDPAAGVGAISIDVDAASATGSADIFMAFYQGADCSSLSLLGCELLLDKSGPNYLLQPVNMNGIDPALDLWVFMYSGQPFTISADVTGFASVPTNDNCAAASTASGTGCNLGATPSTFIPPSNFSAGICLGGTWYSNENTIYYSFTPTTTSATLEIDNINCDDGITGTSQFGIWESCAAVSLAPTLANGFLGCVVGTSPLSLTGLTVGQTYIIVVDGNAGSICTWEFTATGGIILPIELTDFQAVLVDNSAVELNWMTTSESNNDFFTIERTVDGKDFEVVGVVDGAGNSTIILDYKLVDKNPSTGSNYYRLKQTDFDGNHTYSDLVAVEVPVNFTDVGVFPNPVKGNGYLMFNSNTAEATKIVVFDVAGKRIFSKNYNSVKGNNKLIIPTDNLTQGMYLLSVSDGIESTNVKFIKD